MCATTKLELYINGKNLNNEQLQLAGATYHSFSKMNNIVDAGAWEWMKIQEKLCENETGSETTSEVDW